MAINIKDLPPDVAAKILGSNPPVVAMSVESNQQNNTVEKGISSNVQANLDKKKLRKTEDTRSSSKNIRDSKEYNEALDLIRAMNGGFNAMLSYQKNQQEIMKSRLEKAAAKHTDDPEARKRYDELSESIKKMTEAYQSAEFENLNFKQKVEYKKAYTKDFDEKLKKSKTALEAAEKAGDEKAISAATNDLNKLLESKRDLKIDNFELFEAGLSNVLEKGVTGAANELVTEVINKSPFGGAILSIAKGVDRLNTTLNKGVTEATNLASSYLGKIDARLQGSGMSLEGHNTYSELASSMATTFASSPFVKQEKLLASISDLVGRGVAWNVEERALVATLADKMVSTFDAYNESLTRLIRIQGADLTYSSMGSEALLTQFLNSNFNDTSYLNSLYDSVSGALLDASSQLDYQSAIGFNYAAQKWLGSLYSVGVSESGVSNIAQGLNYLATGNVDALSGSSSLQTLLALSAKNAGLDYASLLRGGLNADTTNMLLESMVGYLKGIYGSIDNNVVKSAWSNIAGLNITDLRALSNLSDSNIAAISASSTDFGASTNEFNRQLGLVQGRTPFAERLSNMSSNAVLTFGQSLVNSANNGNILPYLGWSLGDAVGGVLGTVIQTVSGLASLLFSDEFALKDVLTGDVQLSNTAFGNLFSDTASLLNLEKYTGFEDFFKTKGRSDFFTKGVITERAANYVPMLTAMANTDLSATSARGAEWVYTNAAGAVDTGVSTSITNASSVDQMAGSLVNNEVATLSASNVTGASVAVRDIGDIYAKLFEHRDTPIKVTLSDVEDEAKKKLLVDFLTEMSSDVKYLANQAAGSGINIDLGAEDANLLRSQIYNVRYS